MKTSLAERKSLADYDPPRRGIAGRDRKKIGLIAISVVLGTVILLALATTALTVLNRGSDSAATTPAPTGTPTPVPAKATPTPAPTPTPTPTPGPGQAFSNDGPFVMRAFLNGADGQCVVSLKIPNGGPNVDVSNITMSIACDGRTYDQVWSLRPMDWNNADNDTALELEENVATIIDTVKLGIPQGKFLTVRVFRNGDLMQAVSVAPTY